MATKKKTAGKTATEETIGDRVSRLEKIAAYLTRSIAKFGTKSFADVELELGLDIDKDGKVGSAYIRTLLVCAICGLVALSVFAAENVVIRWIAGEGDDAVVRIEADQGDDAADELDIIMGADGEAAISIAGTEVMTLDASGNLTVTGDMSFQDATVGGLTLTGPFQQTATAADGWSYNLVSLTATGAGANLRGWRVNMTTPASSTNGDMQNVHGYLTLGATPTVAASAAMSPLSGWLEMPDGVTFAGAAVISGARVIFDANNNALGSAAAGVEAAIIYGQTWASAGTVDAGLFIAAGAGTTIDSLIETGGSGTVGVLLDVRSMQTAGYADALLTIVRGGPQDATAQTHWGMFAGDQTTRAAVATEVGAASAGSVYFSTAGKIYLCTVQPSTWVRVDVTDQD